MDHKLKILKLWRRLIEFYISVQPSDNDNKIMPEPVVDAIAESVVETVPQQIDHALKIEPTPNEPTAQNTLRPTSIPRSESDSPSTRPLSAREMAQKIDKTSKYVPIQLLEASFVRGVNMPQGLFIVVEAHEAYDLVKNGKATLLNQG
jgi:hypothetical protein